MTGFFPLVNVWLWKVFAGIVRDGIGRQLELIVTSLDLKASLNKIKCTRSAHPGFEIC